jgi:small nuclear ribonucleoprotein (snRNP)-like protein
MVTALFSVRSPAVQLSFWLWLCLCVDSPVQLFYSFFKTLVGKEIIVELKNDIAIRGTVILVLLLHFLVFAEALCAAGILHSVDQYLNIKLHDIKLVDEAKYPHMVLRFLRFLVNWWLTMPFSSPSRTVSFAVPLCAMCSCRPARSTLSCCRTRLVWRRVSRRRLN